MNFFLDTNAVIKIYHEETGTKVLSAFLKRYAPNLILTISDLTPIEFRSSFLRLARTGEADLIMVHEIFRHFDADITRFNIIKIEKDVKTFAIHLLESFAYRRSLRTLDALQLSAALFSHQILCIDRFVSSDKKLLSVAEEFFTIFNPEDEEV
ncbi:MAG: hypothetical protein BWK80_29090 [Desulfobacteraceae bacterium IS3]|nr:MAG: hypothetical protein BWK80_29090 [Desulfobacteraceae bacterium IS3]